MSSKWKEVPSLSSFAVETVTQKKPYISERRPAELLVVANVRDTGEHLHEAAEYERDHQDPNLVGLRDAADLGEADGQGPDSQPEQSNCQDVDSPIGTVCFIHGSPISSESGCAEHRVASRPSGQRGQGSVH